jgi:hypothetical protein
VVPPPRSPGELAVVKLRVGRNDLKTSVPGLTNVNVIQNGTNSLKSQVHRIQSNGQDVVNAAAVATAAKDFANATSSKCS